MLIPIDALNAATPLPLLRAAPTPSDDFFVRSIFGTPDVGAAPWTVSVTGSVERPQSFTLDELRALGEATQVVVVECAGHGRRLMEPLPEGVPWGLGAASVGEFTGVPLRRVLELVGPSDHVVEFVFTGADRGTIEEAGELNYFFSLDADAALADGTSLVWGMNGGSLPTRHGGPLRLLVPGHYGMTSVKWLTAITAMDRPNDNYFNERYRFFDHPGEADGTPVGRMKVRALITSPEEGAAIGRELQIEGVAWSGHGTIASVAIQVDDRDWSATELGPQESAHGPVAWSAAVTLERGRHTIAARATDEAGNTQPTVVPWNRLGYANNVVHRVAVTVHR